MKKIDYININKHIAKIFKEYRIKNNYTQEQVAELSNLSAKYISQLERGNLWGNFRNNFETL